MATPPYAINVSGPVSVTLKQEMADMSELTDAVAQMEAQLADMKQDSQTHAQQMSQLLAEVTGLSAQVTGLSAQVDIAIVTLTDLRNTTTDPALLQRIANGLAQIQEVDMGIEAATSQAGQATANVQQATANVQQTSQKLGQAVSPRP